MYSIVKENKVASASDDLISLLANCYYGVKRVNDFPL